MGQARGDRLAEREGFEPPIRLPVCRISSAVHSTALPPLRSPTGLKKPQLDGGYVAKRAEPDKGPRGYYTVPAPKGRPPSRLSMLRALKFDRVRSELRHVAATLGLVGLVTAVLFPIIEVFGLHHGSVVYLVPVLIAAMRWGIVSAVVAAVCGVVASAFFFYAPLYSLQIKDPHEVLNLILFILVAVVVSQLATRLKRQLELSRQREIDMRDLYAFSRRLAVAFDVSDIHAAIEDHLATIMQRKVVLFAGTHEASISTGQHAGITIPPQVLAAAAEAASSRRDPASGVTVTADSGEVWLVRAVSPRNLELGVIAINFGSETPERTGELRNRVDAVLADATATLERLGVAHAISEARMRSQTDQLREALIGSVSHELRTPLASILGAATVLAAAPALANEKKLKALAHDVRDEAERLNNDIQNLLDASRISSGGVKPRVEWADPADIINSAIERCRRRLADRRVVCDLAADLPLVHVDPVLLQQALVQVLDNAVKYSAPATQIAIAARAQDGRLIVSVTDEGSGLTQAERAQIWERFARGERHAATTSGSGLGLWIANAFIAANGGKINAASAGPGQGSTVAIELPVTQATVPQLENDTDD
jgi:two-component system sensor histidine kinase KdpD